MDKKISQRFSVAAYIDGILSGDRLMLSRAITLVESNLESDRELAFALIEAILPHTGQSVRVGITGVPGVGKSTFIESLGIHIADNGHKVAVLAIDPSSRLSQGSILGDKTRMETLAHNPLAYIRPTPSGHALGGIAQKTRETMLLCEAAGFEVILIETVGVGQAETAVRDLVDFFLLLMLSRAGDELQGLKRGIMEMCDGILITKADGDNQQAALLAKSQYTQALHLFAKPASGWQPVVAICSAVQNLGIDAAWENIKDFKQQTMANGWFAYNREQQNLSWMHQALQQGIYDYVMKATAFRERLAAMENLVKTGQKDALRAVQELLSQLEKHS